MINSIENRSYLKGGHVHHRHHIIVIIIIIIIVIMLIIIVVIHIRMRMTDEEWGRR
jgi:hypothetical protein